MKHLIPLLILSFLLTGFTGCEKPTEPKDTPEPDTTSHNFVWRVDTIGTYLSLVRDVAIVDENNIWAVGEFYKKHTTFDSTAKDQYNAAHWDGVRWELKRYYPQTYVDFLTGSTPDFPYEINSIWIFSADNIFMVSYAGSYIWFRNGEVKTRYIENRSGGMTKIWAKDESNIWIVGEKGTIIYYNGTTFTKIPYAESVDFVDIWGDETGVVRAVARKPNSFESAIVKISQLSAEVEYPGLNKLSNQGTPDFFYSVYWRTSETTMILASNGLFFKKVGAFFRARSNYDPGTYDFISVLRGNNENDFFGCGGFTEVIHYNGKGFKKYPEIKSDSPGTFFSSLSVKNGVACAGGISNKNSMTEQSVGLVAIGVRK